MTDSLFQEKVVRAAPSVVFSSSRRSDWMRRQRTRCFSLSKTKLPSFFPLFLSISSHISLTSSCPLISHQSSIFNSIYFPQEWIMMRLSVSPKQRTMDVPSKTRDVDSRLTTSWILRLDFEDLWHPGSRCQPPLLSSLLPRLPRRQ